MSLCMTLTESDRLQLFTTGFSIFKAFSHDGKDDSMVAVSRLRRVLSETK